MEQFCHVVSKDELDWLDHFLSPSVAQKSNGQIIKLNAPRYSGGARQTITKCRLVAEILLILYYKHDTFYGNFVKHFYLK